jgi:hypothetical protein
MGQTPIDAPDVRILHQNLVGIVGSAIRLRARSIIRGFSYSGGVLPARHIFAGEGLRYHHSVIRFLCKSGLGRVNNRQLVIFHKVKDFIRGTGSVFLL